jgi:hypothetical protein
MLARQAVDGIFIPTNFPTKAAVGEHCAGHQQLARSCTPQRATHRTQRHFVTELFPFKDFL